MKPPRRHSIRLPGYDYARPGAYFVTICTKSGESVFGAVVEGEVRLKEAGRIVQEEWARSASVRREIVLDEYVIMPNHLHGIVLIKVGATGRSPLQSRSPLRAGEVVFPARSPLRSGEVVFPARSPLPSGEVSRPGPGARSLASFVGGFKSAATKRINVLRRTPRLAVWQRNYYEHIIRDEDDLRRIRQYIANNPLAWSMDEENQGLSGDW
jgi:REP element-mobilizing transposase RayT